ncbi:MAG: hypothetical protein QNJ31_01300 [Candidatus Caenarcaniphilales bacterium]|nr:hypothetical protein [Candidatus Caenarcaniphilales bacterium]
MATVSLKSELPKLAIFGAGGLGIEMVKLLKKRQAANLVAMVDQSGYVFDENGLNDEQLIVNSLRAKSIAAIENSVQSSKSISEFLERNSTKIDAIFYALPNLPNEFIPNITKEIINQSEFNGVIVDALKRTKAVKMLSEFNSQLQEKNILYLTGCGATPGMLTSAAAVAAQSFVEIESVKITFGVGISNWKAYRATIREDIAHLKNFNVEKVSQMTEEQIDKELEDRNGILELVDMEHADDIMLEMAGICDADKVTVGGIVDTRNPQKPVSTNVKITGFTYEGKKSTHTFTLGDETTMAANVNGTVLGFLNAGVNLHKNYGISGLRTAAEVMPRFNPVKIHKKSLAEII